jgi:hypothetical protein
MVNKAVGYSVLGRYPSSGILKKKTTFRKLDLFPSLRVGARHLPLSGPLERFNDAGPISFGNLV